MPVTGLVLLVWLDPVDQIFSRYSHAYSRYRSGLTSSIKIMSGTSLFQACTGKKDTYRSTDTQQKLLFFDDQIIFWFQILARIL